METENEHGNFSQGMRKNPNLPATSSVDIQDSAGSIQAGHSPDGIMSNGDVIDTLNNLLEICHDGEFGFTECAEHVKTAEVKSVFAQRAGDCRSAAAELQQLIAQMGGVADSGGTMGGAAHRGWVSVKGTLAGYSDISMLEECEHGEDVALARYQKALKQSLPASVISVVTRQAQGTQKNHDQIKGMRDAHKTAAGNA